jgi:hypothetical protein
MESNCDDGGIPLSLEDSQAMPSICIATLAEVGRQTTVRTVASSSQGCDGQGIDKNNVR